MMMYVSYMTTYDATCLRIHTRTCGSCVEKYYTSIVSPDWGPPGIEIGP